MGCGLTQIRTERCPYCGQPITHDQLVRIREKVRKEVSAESRAALERRKSQLELEFHGRVTREVSKREKSLQREFDRLRRELTSGQSALTRERAALGKRETLAERRNQRAEAELDRRARKLEEEAKQRAKELAEREHVHFEAVAARQQAGFEKERLDWQRKQNALQKQVDGLMRRVEEKTAYALQEYSEEKLANDLREAFRDDGIERLERGRRVGDVRQVVTYKGQEVGVIVFEVKNVKGWQNAFVEQAKQYRTVHNTPHIILVTAAMPGKTKSLTAKDGILVVAPEHAILVVRLIRDGLVAMARARLSTGEKEAKVAQLYVYLTSGEYREKAEGVVAGVRRLRDLQGQEQEAHRRVWQKQEQQHKKIDSDIGEIRSKVEAIIETEIPSVALKAARQRKKPPITDVVATP